MTIFMRVSRQQAVLTGGGSPTGRQFALHAGRAGASWRALAGGLLTAAALALLALLSGDQPPLRGLALFPVCVSGDLTHNTLSAARPGQPDAGTVKAPYRGMWITAGELAALPTSGPAWEALLAAANADPGQPNLSDQNEDNDVYTLAEALVYARTGQESYRQRVLQNLSAVIGTERGGRTLALSRNLVSYVIAADLVNLPADPAQDTAFRAWLTQLLNEDLDGKSLRSTQEERPNNWGTHAGASRVAVALYLGDQAELQRAAEVFQGYLGDTSAYSGFKYDKDLSWQCDPAHPVGINPRGCVVGGHLVDGALPEEMRRGASFQWPPAPTGYAWEGLQGAFVTAELLSRAGFPAWQWSDQALLRAANFLYSIDWPAQKDDNGYPWLLNHAYGTHFPAALPALPGKNIGWLDWTFSGPPDQPAIQELPCP